MPEALPSASSSLVPEYYPSSILWLFLAPALGGFLFGYDIGGTSFAVMQLAATTGGDEIHSGVSLRDAPVKTGWFVSSPAAGALLGTAVLVVLEEREAARRRRLRRAEASEQAPSRGWTLPPPPGRRTELTLAGLWYALGGFLQLAARHAPLPFGVLLLGRWAYGIGIGLAMHGGPTYLAETTPPALRGYVVGGKEIAIVAGILAGYGVGNALCRLPHGWAAVYGWTLPLSIAMVGLSRVVPESPRYLVSLSPPPPPVESKPPSHATTSQDSLRQRSPGGSGTETSFADDEEIPAAATSGRQTQQQPPPSDVDDTILEALRFVWRPLRAREEHQRLLEASKKQRAAEADHASLADLLTNPSYRPALTAGLGLVVLQQVTGQPSVLSYATPILSRVPGLSASSSVVLGLFKVLATAGSVLLVEHHGRTTLLKRGCSLMLGALIVLAWSFREDGDRTSPNDDDDDTEAALDTRAVLALGGMFVYIAGYQIGFGPISWLMISEVFPQSVRGTAVGLAVQANFALNAAVQFVVPLLRQSIGLSKTFGLFGVLTAYSLWFVAHRVPETRGLTLEEIEERLAGLALPPRNPPPAGSSGDGSKAADPGDERIQLLAGASASVS